MNNKLFFGHLLTLIFGGLIYVLFRSESLTMFKWFASLSLDAPIEYLRETTVSIKPFLPQWFLFSLPDGLWVFSYCSLMLLIWDSNVSKQNILWFCLIPFIAVFSELGQLLNVVPGTFDVVDLAFYIIGAITPFVIFSNNLLIFKQNKYE